jgi:hypothetical protein
LARRALNVGRRVRVNFVGSMDIVRGAREARARRGSARQKAEVYRACANGDVSSSIACTVASKRVSASAPPAARDNDSGGVGHDGSAEDRDDEDQRDGADGGGHAAQRETATIFGALEKPGPYVVAVKWNPGYMSAPYTHVTDRLCFVLSGTWWVNSGEDFDPNGTVPVRAGRFVRRVAHTPTTRASRRARIRRPSLAYSGLTRWRNVGLASSGRRPMGDIPRKAMKAALVEILRSD